MFVAHNSSKYLKVRYVLWLVIMIWDSLFNIDYNILLNIIIEHILNIHCWKVEGLWFYDSYLLIW